MKKSEMSFSVGSLSKRQTTPNVNIVLIVIDDLMEVSASFELKQWYFVVLAECRNHGKWSPSRSKVRPNIGGDIFRFGLFAFFLSSSIINLGAIVTYLNFNQKISLAHKKSHLWILFIFIYQFYCLYLNFIKFIYIKKNYILQILR